MNKKITDERIIDTIKSLLWEIDVAGDDCPSGIAEVADNLRKLLDL